MGGSRGVGVVLGVVVVAAGGWAALSARGPLVDALRPVRQPLTETLLIHGRVSASGRAELGVTVQGTVVEVVVDEGDAVEAGALLVRLADDDARARVSEAEAQVAEARAHLAKVLRVGRPLAAERLEQARQRAEEALGQYERKASLSAAGGVADAELEAARRERDVTQSQVVAAELEVAATERGGADSAAASAALARAQATLDAARAAVEHTRVRAPTAGRILQRSVEPGQVVAPGEPLLVFSGDAPMELRVTPDEVHLGHLAPGQAAQVRFEAFPDEVLEAHVRELAPQIDAGRGTVAVDLALDPPLPGWLRPDMTATVEIVLGQTPDALVLPVGAVRDLGDAPWVLVVEDGRARRRDVTVGAQDAALVAVTSGLDEDDAVLAPERPVEVGARVRVRALVPTARGERE